MTRPSLCAGAVVVAAAAIPILGQTPDLSGTWKLDLQRSRITTPLLHGGGDGGPSDTLHVTHAANGTVTVGSRAHSANAWAYTPGRATAMPLGETDSITVTTRWEDGRLVSEGSRDAKGRDAIVGVKAVHWLSPDGQTLTIEETTRTATGTGTNTLVYQKVR